MTDQQRPFAGETMTYAFAETGIGTILAAAGDRGVTALLIGSDRTRLRRELGEILASADLREDGPAMAETLKAVTRLAANPADLVTFALDLRGSRIEQAVWDALRRIPAGATIGYGALARTLPVPATAQEVGAACAANRVAIAVPCHRVVKADGGISGYRWGVARKRRLLELEAAA
ncbi:MAG TPA: methylated-DNA--[protein]-cysteine S-methyltransferase [Allosphingosinicella sp.]|jgi:AraC family transcriptional regulator of adaptative response/methylated-DNA-[protein]-cysteine methyltransferase